MERAMNGARRFQQQLRAGEAGQRVIALLGKARAQLEGEPRPTGWRLLRLWLRKWLLFSLCLAGALYTLYFIWQGDDWSDWILFWIIAGFAALLSLAFLPDGPNGPPVDPRSRALLDLREAAARGDDTAVQRSPWQPGPLDVSDPAAARRLRPLYRADAGQARSQLVYTAAFNLLWAVLLAAQLDLHTLTSAWWSRLGPVVVALNLYTGVTSVVQLFLLARGFAVEADEAGLNWREGRHRRRITWSDVRSLGVVDLPDGGLYRPGGGRPRRRVYALDAGDTVLAWAPSLGAYHRRQDDHAWLLCRVVVARTGLSLRDLTPGAERIVETKARVRAREVWREMFSFISRDTTGFRRGLRIAFALTPFAAALLLALSVILAGVGVLVFQPRSYAERLAVARASAPLLRDPLTVDTGLWPTSADRQSFTGGAYTLAGTGGPAYAWAPNAFGDVEFEVTMQHITSYDFQNAGLIVRADDATQTMLVFAITADGRWRFSRVSMQLSDDLLVYPVLAQAGFPLPVGAIHQGLDATNRLAVIMRGSSYAFFINDQYVGAYHDDGGPTSGHVGMYVDGYSGTAAYTDLAIYPTPQPSLLAPV